MKSVCCCYSLANCCPKTRDCQWLPACRHTPNNALAHRPFAALLSRLAVVLYSCGNACTTSAGVRPSMLRQLRIDKPQLPMCMHRHPACIDGGITDSPKSDEKEMRSQEPTQPSCVSGVATKPNTTTILSKPHTLVARLSVCLQIPSWRLDCNTGQWVTQQALRTSVGTHPINPEGQAAKAVAGGTQESRTKQQPAAAHAAGLGESQSLQ